MYLKPKMSRYDKDALLDHLISRFPVGNLDSFRANFEEWWSTEGSHAEEILSTEDKPCHQAEPCSLIATPQQSPPRRENGPGCGQKACILDPGAPESK
jgi:hypothetical protein